MFYDTQSLKQKRSILKSIIAKVRNNFNVSISEIDFQDMWQRTKLGIAVVANTVIFAEKVIQEVLKVIDSFTQLERTITTVDRL